MMFSEKLKIDECFGLAKSQCQSKEITSEELNISSLKFKGKTIVVLCGNNTKDFMKASTYTKHCFNWLRNYPGRKAVTAYSIYYKKSQPLLNSLNPNPAFDYDGLTKILFKQVVYKNNKIQSVEDIAQSLSNITFFGHSIGGYIMNEIMQNFEIMLKEKNFSDADINKIFSSIVFISYSPFALVDYPINNIYIAPIYDSVGSTRLVYNKMRKNKKFISSNPTLNLFNNNKLKTDSYSNFIKQYEVASHNADLLYFMDKNSLVLTPNLLYDDGIKEDHNLAGVINYSQESPYKTKAGKITTKLLNQIFKYSVSTERTKFSTTELFQQIDKIVSSANEQNILEKEL